MTTELVDEWNDRYTPIDGFELRTRNDFTIREFAEYVGGGKFDDYDDDTGEGAEVEYLYPKRPDVDEKGHSLTEKHPNGNPSYLGLRYRERDGVNPIGYRYYEPEEISYEGGIVQGLGHVKVLDNGNLGDGHEAWVLFEHVESGRFFRLGGYYSSWGSGEMDDWVEVVPAQVTVVRYADINDHSKVFDNPAVTV